MKTIVFAGGCFWGIEAYFKRLEGVVYTEVGYANGNAENPDYRMVCRGDTGYAEACMIGYDESRLSLETLLEAFWKVIDPTVADRQGPDIGNQYRTGIYYSDPADLDTLLKSRDLEQQKYSKRIVTEIQPLRNFFKAEEYHQDYLDKNPGGYCHIKL